MADYLPISDYPASYKQLRVDPNKPQDQLRKLDLIALEHFDGYIPMALHHVYFVSQDKELGDSIADDLTSVEANLLVEMVHRHSMRKGGKDVFDKAYKLSAAEERTGMTVDDIRAAEKNPFVKPMWLSVGLLLGVLALFIVGAMILAKVAPGETTANIASCVVYVGMILLLTNIVKKVQQVLAFRSVKKLLPWYDGYSTAAAEPDATPYIPELPAQMSAIEDRALKQRTAIFVPLFLLLCLAVVVSCLGFPATKDPMWLVGVLVSLILLVILVIVTIRKGDAITQYLARRIEKKQARKKQQ